MIVDQMRFEIWTSFLHEFSLSGDPMFMAQQLKQRYTNGIVNIIIEGDTSEEKEALRKELDCRVQSLKVSSNLTKAIIEVQ